MPNLPPQNLTVATTGASGSLFLKHFLFAVERDQRIKTVNFIASDSALRVMAEELNLRGRSNLTSQILGKSSRKIHQQSNTDIRSPTSPAGSYPRRCDGRDPLQRGHACPRSQRHRLASDRARRRRLPQGKASPGALCVRETRATQQRFTSAICTVAADAAALLAWSSPLFPPSTITRQAWVCYMARGVRFPRACPHRPAPAKCLNRWKGPKRFFNKRPSMVRKSDTLGGVLPV